MVDLGFVYNKSKRGRYLRDEKNGGWANRRRTRSEDAGRKEESDLGITIIS